MPKHDLKHLSSRDFEELSRDLLQAEWGVALEAFKAGRDQGIDLRHLSAHGGATIVQCKHYAVSGYAKLLGHLKSGELGKVRRLKPNRYVLVTSVELTANNKDEIVELFRPFILAPDDVKGANDIDGLLQRHEHVARSNFKLWLTSTEVLERVLHNAEACQTEFEVERVRRKLPIFVQNAAYPRAQEILEKNNVLVVSGVPGIGKTTLAEILLYAHLEGGYEPVVIQNDVREGKKLFSSKRPQVFYFDDFLGQTFLGEGRFPGGLNSDVSLVDFVEMIRATGRSRFILTTREHLLQGAHTASERLRHSSLLDYRCLLELIDYSKGQRARILYNHLYFSDLPCEYKEQMLHDDFFLEVIEHDHFNPRLVEWLSAYARLREVPGAKYQRHVRNVLANPQEIWSHAFNHQISPASRDLLLALYSQRDPCDLVELEPVWRNLNAHATQKYNRQSGPKDYQNALKELDNAFVTYGSGRAEFLNPSVREMVAAEITDCPEHVLALIATASRFQQIATLFDLAEQDGKAAVKRVFVENSQVLTRSIAGLLRTSHLRWETNAAGRPVGHHVDIPLEERLTRIGRMAHVLHSESLRSLFESEICSLVALYAKGGFDMGYATSLVEAFDAFPALKAGAGAALQRELLNSILADQDSWWAGQLNALIDCSGAVSIWTPADDTKLDKAIAEYRANGLWDEYDNCHNLDDYSRLRDDLSTLGEKLGVPFERDIERIEERMGELEPPYDSERRGGGSVRSMGGVSGGKGDTDEVIREVFGTLLE
jgi:hypothetical protein